MCAPQGNSDGIMAEIVADGSRNTRSDSASLSPPMAGGAALGGVASTTPEKQFNPKSNSFESWGVFGGVVRAGRRGSEISDAIGERWRSRARHRLGERKAEVLEFRR